MSYPDESHNLHNDLQFMCKKRKISEVQKLVPNLFSKKKYVIHIMALDQALKHGLVLDKVCQVIELDLSAWFTPYIEFNTQLRTRAMRDFGKDFFKLMNNSVFGKMIENVRKHRDIKLVTSWKAYLKKVMKQNFRKGILFSENLMVCVMGKIRIVMNKPISLRQAILDLSKIILYEFHYEYMKWKYKVIQSDDMSTLAYRHKEASVMDVFRP